MQKEVMTLYIAGGAFVSTVEPPNKGHFGTSHFVLCREAVFFSEVKNVLVQWEGCAEMCPLQGGCLFLGGSTV